MAKEKKKVKHSRSMSDDETDGIYEVEEIVAFRFLKSELQFYIKWLNYPASCNTWEPTDNLKHCTIFQEYVDAKFRSMETDIFINHINIRNHLGKKISKAMQQPKRITMQEVQPFDKFDFKVNQVFYHLLPKTEEFKHHLEAQVFKNYFIKLDEVQQQQNNELLMRIRKKEDIAVTIENDVDFEAPPQFEYITKKLLSEEKYIFNPTGIAGCKCMGTCEQQNQCCPKLMSQGFPYKSVNGQTVLRLRKGNIYECGDLCACGPDCINRLTQQPKKVPLCLFKTENCGWGVKALSKIPKGTFILEYVGELLGQTEANSRTETAYLFDLDFNRRKNDQLYTIDAFIYGNLSRFVNHSCAANVIIRIINHCHGDPKNQKLCFFADRLIGAGEEITIDYKGGDDDRSAATLQCLCGADNCKRYVY